MPARLASGLLVVASLVALPLVAGCADSLHAPTSANVAAPELNRQTALTSARTDAARQFGGDAWVAATDAQMVGRFWVVELHARNGSLVRYTISSRDGSIRERSVLQ